MKRSLYSQRTVLRCGLFALLAVAGAGKTLHAQTLYVSASGKINTVTPTGTVTPLVTIQSIAGLAFDANGVLFASSASSPNGTIYKVAQDGTTSSFATGLIYPQALNFDTTGNLYYGSTDGGANAIFKITPGGTISTFATGFDSTTLAIDAGGNVYAAGVQNPNNTISKISSSGAVSTFATGISYPQGLIFDTLGNLYVSSVTNTLTQQSSIFKITPGGNVSTFASGLNSAFGMAFDAKGNLFVANNSSNGTISKIAPDGTVSTFATGLNGPTFLAFQPSAVAPEPVSADLLWSGIPCLAGASLMIRSRRTRRIE